MRRPDAARLAAAILTAAAVLCPAAAPAAAKTRAWRIAAGPWTRKAPQGAAAPISRFTLQGLTVSVEYLEPPARAALVARLDPDAGGDPFAAAPGRPETYHAFRVVFDNRSAEEILFQAGNVVLIFDAKHQQFPIDTTDLYRLAARAALSDPEAMMEQAKRVMFDSSTTIPARTRAERLLVFGTLPEKWKEMRVHFSFLQIGAETHSMSFLFHRRPAEG